MTTLKGGQPSAEQSVKKPKPNDNSIEMTVVDNKALLQDFVYSRSEHKTIISILMAMQTQHDKMLTVLERFEDVAKGGITASEARALIKQARDIANKFKSSKE